jgi:hypothetical protein
MSDDDDWDSVPVVLNKSAIKDDDEERVQLEESVKSKESSKPKNALDEKAALAKATAQSKSKQREREEELARQAESERNAKPMTAEERAAEALRRRRLVEESDAELVKDLYGTGSGSQAQKASAISASAAQARALDGVQDLDTISGMLATVQLDTPRQTNELCVALTKRVERGGKKAVLAFLKEFMREASEPINDDDVNELIGVLTVIRNEKVKAKNLKKKGAGAPKPKLNTSGLDRPGGDRYDLDGIDDRGTRGKGFKNPYEAEDDFM